SPRRSPAPVAWGSTNRRRSPRDEVAIRCPRPDVCRARSGHQPSRDGARIALPCASRAAAVRSGGRGGSLPTGCRRRAGRVAHAVPVGCRMTWLTVVALVFAVAGVLLVIGGLRALWRARIWGFTSRTLAGLLLLVIGLLGTAIGIGVQGYQALTHEERIARITIEPKEPQRFDVRIAFPDSRVQTFE